MLSRVIKWEQWRRERDLVPCGVPCHRLPWDAGQSTSSLEASYLIFKLTEKEGEH